MPRRSRLSIPHELHQIKAQQIYEQRIAKGKNNSPEGDWETARRYLTRYPKVVRAWKCKQAIAFYRQLLRSFFRRLVRSLKGLINGIGKIITFPFWLFYGLPQLFANTDTQLFALDVVKTIISAASLIAAIIAAFGLLVNYQDALKNRELTQERLVTDRFAKAVEQLGNDKEEVIIGGIYSLERIAKDSPKDQWTIMEVLTAFVRKNSPIPPEIQNLIEKKERSKALEKLAPVNIQIQAALTVIGRRDPKQDYTSEEERVRRDPKQDSSSEEDPVKRLDLNYSNLSDADLSDANLINANLSDADLSDANLINANLSDANLINANLSDANLINANLSDANLINANLRDAYLSSANLSGADLINANLRDAYLFGVQNLSNQQIKSACFWDKAIYTVVWIYREGEFMAVYEKVNQKTIEAIKQDKASDPKNPPDCSRWK